MAEYTYNTKATYEELQEQERKILENIEKLNSSNEELIKGLEQLRQQYPNELRILPENLEELKTENMSDRLSVIRKEIRKSSNIKEEEKEPMIKAVEKAIRRVARNVKIVEQKEKELVPIRTEIERIRRYVTSMSKFNEERKERFERLIAKSEQQIKKYETILNDEDMPESVKEPTREELEVEKEKIESLKQQIEEIENREKGVSGQVSEKSAEEILEEPVSEVKEPQVTPVVETQEAPTTEPTPAPTEEPGEKKKEEVSEVLNPIVPEEPQPVVEKHKASPELIAKLKTAGKIGLGVLAVGAAVAAVIANPLALAALPAGGLIWDQAKEHVFKK